MEFRADAIAQFNGCEIVNTIVKYYLISDAMGLPPASSIGLATPGFEMGPKLESAVKRVIGRSTRILRGIGVSFIHYNN